MDMQTPEPISIRPIDMGLVMAAGDPGTFPRLMVVNTLQLLNESCAYEHKGRGDPGYDWLGFVLAIAQRSRRDLEIEGDLEDLVDYAAGWRKGVPVELAGQLFERWGFRRRDQALDMRPGDILLFEMPTAHAAVCLAAADGANPPRAGHAYWGRAPVQTWLGPWWAEHLHAAYEFAGA